MAATERRRDWGKRDRVSNIQNRWEVALRRMWLAIIGLYLVALIGGYLLWRQNHEIQQSRIDAVVQTCEESNARHDRTVAAFRREFKLQIESQHLTSTQLARARSSRDANLRLINVFVPTHKDAAGNSTCVAYAKGIVSV